MTKQPGRARKSLKERFFDYLTRVVLTRHFQKMKIAKQDTNYIEQQLMIKTNQGAKRIGVVTLRLVDGLTPADKLSIAATQATSDGIKIKKLQDENDSLKHKLKLSIDALKHSDCLLKKAASFYGRDPFCLHRQEVIEIDCAVALIGRVLKFVCDKAKSGIAQDTEQPPKNQEGTTE